MYLQLQTDQNNTARKAKMTLQCLTIFFHIWVLHVCSSVNVDIALLTIDVPIPLDIVENLTATIEGNNPYLDFHNVSTHILEIPEDNTIKYKDLASTLRCNATSLLISTDSCNPNLAPIMALEGQNLYRVNSGLECELNNADHPYTDVYPSNVPVDSAIDHVSHLLQWSYVNILYDDPKDVLLKKLIASFSRDLTRIQLYRITPDTREDEIMNILTVSDQKRSDGGINNNIVLCKLLTTRMILEKAAVREAQFVPDGSEESLYHSRWLVILRDPTDVLSIDGVIQDLFNVGVLLIKQQFTTDVYRAVEDLVAGLTTGLDYYTTVNNDTSTLYKPTDANCRSFKSNEIKTILQPYLDVLPEYKTCTAYRAFTTEWTEDARIRLVEENLCDTNSKMLRNIDFFPAERRGFNGKLFKITTVKSDPPFIIELTELDATENSTVTRKGGICLDLLEELSVMLNFTYEVSEVPDGQYGLEGEDGRWTGMVGQLHRKEVDMAFAPLSVTPERDSVVDFIEFFAEYGGILIKKPDENEDKWKVIAEPFTWQVWVCIIFSIPLAGFAAWFISWLVVRVTNHESDMFVDINNSMWYVFGALFTQGGSYEPTTTPGRAFIGCWWGFCIVIVASYGGSLIAYLTITKGDPPFNSLEEMVEQTRYMYGTTGGSVYISEFQLATGGELKKVWEGIERNVKIDPSILDTSRAVQLEKVASGDYAYISDRTALERVALADTECKLQLLGDTFLPLMLGIGIQEDVKYRSVLNKAVLTLQQSGMIKFWQQKWRPKETCSSIPIPLAEKISLMDVQSAFYCLCGGVFFAACALLSEFLRYSCNKNSDDNEDKKGENDIKKTEEGGSSHIRSIYSYN